MLPPSTDWTAFPIENFDRNGIAVLEVDSSVRADKRLESAFHSALESYPVGGAAAPTIFGNTFVDEPRSIVSQCGLGELEVLAAESLARSSKWTLVRRFHDQLVLQRSGSLGIGWHTNQAYWKNARPGEVHTAIASVAANLNPKMHFIPFSHRSDLPHERLQIHSPLPSSFPRLDNHTLDEVVSIQLKPTHLVIVHGCLLRAFDGSGEGADMMKFQVHLQSGENRFERARENHMLETSHFVDVLAAKDQSGLPDYQDDQVFPQLWP